MLDVKRHGALSLFLLLALSLLSGAVAADLSITRGSAPTQAQQTTGAPEWVYTLRSGETLTEVTQTLLTDRVSLNQLTQYNNLAGNANLSVGDQVRIPLGWLKRQPEPAKATSVAGNVIHVSGSNGQKTPLTDNSIIRVGDEAISAAGTATIILADGSELRMAPNSRLIFNRLTQYGKAGMADTRLRLQRGEVHTRVKPVMEDGARFEIETPSAVAAVRGTVFSMQASGSGSSVQVTEGVVDFGQPGKTRRIPAGYGASVSTTSTAPMNIRQLPPAPVLNPIAPVLKQLPAELSWQQNGADRYRVDIFADDSGAWLQSRDTAEARFDISQLDNGRYEIHLASLDPQGITGMPAIASIEVDLRARTPDLISPEEGQGVNDDMPEFHWQLKGTNEVARVEIAEDEAFQRLITSSEWAPDNRALPSRPLSPGQYFWRVVTEAGGNSVATSPTRTLVVNGTLPPVRIISINYIDNQVRVFWEKVDTANDYRLQLAEEPAFNNIIKEANVAETTAALRLIPGRRYFVRVKALSDGPLASRWGPGRELYLD
ncbi:MAG: FecR family protein [Marinobacter excellens HL-55]|uniref:FecR family protein n=1 Tax=Marinobacter excellens HL-55 TaxID=1305731 RepID=A0A0P8CV85_9GAMM|nr:MAG: FecR family protein [Marinobacter excellens HL-55]